MISLEKRTKCNAMVNQRLAEVVDLQLQVKQACWNVRRSQSTSLHELFEEIAREVACFTDMVAERIVQLGGMARGTVRTAAVHSRLVEYPSMAGNRDHVEAVAWVLSDFGHQARKAVKEALALEDSDTADLFTEIYRGIDKWLWIVQGHAKAARYQASKTEPFKANTASGFRLLMKFKQRNQNLRKGILCQSSITSALRTAHR